MRFAGLLPTLLATLVMTDSAANEPAPVVARVDHLVYAVPDLEAGMDQIEELTGVRPVIGGQHPGMGTWNALISLGPSVYLEIIAPDPSQADYRSPRVFRIDESDLPRLTTWAANSTDVGALTNIALPDGQAIGAAQAGSRQRPDGVTLNWTLSDPYVVVADGVVPFFIDWGDTPHPATASPQGAILVSLRAEHPEPDAARQSLASLSIDLPVSLGDEPALIATLNTPKGTVELR